MSDDVQVENEMTNVPFRELAQLNVFSNGVRYWLDDGVVRAAMAVQCTALSSLARCGQPSSKGSGHVRPDVGRVEQYRLIAIRKTTSRGLERPGPMTVRQRNGSVATPGPASPSY